MKKKTLWEIAHFEAAHFCEAVESACARVEIAGSLRRMAREVGDIEIVAEPSWYEEDLFGDLTGNHSLDLFDWSALGELKLNGHKQKKIFLPNGLAVDVFIVTPPAQWGVQFLLRTSPADFSHKMVTSKSYGGYKPHYLEMRGGAFYNSFGVTQKTPEEQDVFNLFGMAYIEPQKRG